MSAAQHPTTAPIRHESPPLVPRSLQPPALRAVRINEEGFWGSRRRTNRDITLPSQLRQLTSNGAIGQLDRCHAEMRQCFYDSDVAKWLEAVCEQAQGGSCDRELAASARAVMARIQAMQDPDGYLGSWLGQDPARRYRDLRLGHELYTMGHMLEACCAYQAAGWDDCGTRVAVRLIDHLWTVFGPDGQPGYCGHPELELALMRWWRLSGDGRAHTLAQLQVDRRGQDPQLFTVEARERGVELESEWSWRFSGDWRYFQAHRPVREQAVAEGHAVRALYLYAGMADLAAAGDPTLIPVLRRLWSNAVQRRMYLIGGMGSTKEGERIGEDYDLPDDTAYCETCAAIALARWARRMLALDLDGAYGDVMERSLHNNVLAGVDLGGERYFYSNPLAVAPHHRRGSEAHVRPERQAWFGCACCPPNISRTLSQLGDFAYGQDESLIAVHLYLPGSADLVLHGVPIRLSVSTGLPWAGWATIRVQSERPVTGTIALRLPGWCTAPHLRINGAVVPEDLTSGTYLHLNRTWQDEELTLVLPMQAQRVFAHPAVRSAAGKVAVQRGPLVYAWEEQDAGADLDDYALDDTSELLVGDSLQCGGMVTISAGATRTAPQEWDGPLYRTLAPPRTAVRITAIPYCLWGNRTPGEMRVWMRRS